MKNVVSSLVASLLISVQFSMAEQWPQFRGPNRDGVSSSSGLLRSWPADGPRLIWTAIGAGRGYSSVAIADGKVLTLGDAPSTADDKDEYLLCFDLRNGDQLWKSRLGEAWNEGPDDWQSSRSTPTLDGDRAYVLAAHGGLFCVDTNKGSILWQKNVREDFGGKKGDGWGYGESVLIDGDRLICTPGGGQKTMVALNKQTGELIWSAVRDDDRGAGHASIVISQIAGTKVYVQTTASGPLGVRASDGVVLWSYPIEETTAVIPTPIVRNELVFFAAGYGRGGALLRQVPTANGIDIEEIYPLNSKLDNKHGGVVAVGGYVYGDTSDKGMPYCADMLTGELKWKERGSGKGSAAIVAADGHLYILFSNATVVLAKASSEGYTEVSRFELPSASEERPSWAHPVVADDKLYLRHDDKIFCYAVGS